MSSFDSSLGVESSQPKDAILEAWAFYVRNFMPALQRMEVCDLENNAAHLLRWCDKANLQGFREPREVFLVEPPPESIEGRCLEGVGAALLNYARWSQSWEANVEHFRIDNVDVNKGSIFSKLHLDPAQLHKLKILVIRGFPRYPRGDWVWEARDLEEKTYGRLGRPRPEGQSNFLEWKLADAIRQLDLPALRMVVIGDYHFWVWRLDDYSESVRAPLRFFTIPMSDAMGMTVHAATIEREMTEWDWDFVMDDTSVLLQDAREEFRRAASKVVFRK